MDAVRDTYIIRSQARWWSQLDVIRNGYRGREMRFDISVKYRVIFRTYAVNRRVYMLHVSREKEEPPSDVVVPFFDSFQITQ